MTHFPEYAWKYTGINPVKGLPTLFYQAKGEKPEDTWTRFCERYKANPPNKSEYQVVEMDKIVNPEDTQSDISTTSNPERSEQDVGE